MKTNLSTCCLICVRRKYTNNERAAGRLEGGKKMCKSETMSQKMGKVCRSVCESVSVLRRTSIIVKRLYVFAVALAHHISTACVCVCD